MLRPRHFALIALGGLLAIAAGVYAQGGYPTIARFTRVGIGAAPATAGGAAATIGGALSVENTGPVLRWIETDAAANNQRWRDYVNAGVLNRCVLNDAEGVETCYLSATRSGTTVTLLNLAATSITGNGVALTPSQGTFTASFDDACTTTGTVVFDWTAVGNLVTIVGKSSALVCTGDSTSFATTGTPVPAAIRPNTLARTGPLAAFFDNGAAAWGCMSILPNGNVQFSKATSTTLCADTGWTAAGSRTVAQPEQFVISYMLGNP
jgi:hypothetical protein